MAFNQHGAYISLPAVTTYVNEPQDLRGYWTKVRQIFSRCNFSIDGVNATIRVAILPPIVNWEGWQNLKKKAT